MRKASLIAIFLTLAIWSWGQDAPAAAPPGGQPPATSEGQRGEGRRFQGIAGTITAIQGNAITVKTMDGGSAQVNLSDKTRYRKDRQPAQLSDFKVGDQIMVRGEPAGDNAWTADVVAARPAGGPGGDAFREAMGKRFIVGEIKSINGTQLTIQRPDGVSQTIAVDESTSFKKQGESVTLADLKAGDHVFGRGEVKNDVFVPAELNVGDLRMMMRGGSGQGGPAQGQGQGQGGAAPDSH
jgi:ribosomal protein L21E